MRGQPRLAATIFIQPALDATLDPLPSPSIPVLKAKGKGLSYGAWKERVYGRYHTKQGKKK